ncbi:MAG: hypothetical protein RL238_1775 [Actinomycetota bacterium]|jgi:hypothetical protein
MERRIALAAAGATAGTLGLGTICFAAVGGSNILGMASAQAPAEVDVITEVQEIQRVVVVRSSSTTLPGGTTIPTVLLEVPVPAAPTQVATPTPATPAPRPATPATTLAPTTSRPVVTVVQVPVTAAPTTTAKATTTTAKPVVTTTTVRPRGVPADWPADKPIPPKPANCKDAQLELNGVWNCDD